MNDNSQNLIKKTSPYTCNIVYKTLEKHTNCDRFVGIEISELLPRAFILSFSKHGVFVLYGCIFVRFLHAFSHGGRRTLCYIRTVPTSVGNFRAYVWILILFSSLTTSYLWPTSEKGYYSVRQRHWRLVYRQWETASPPIFVRYYQ